MENLLYPTYLHKIDNRNLWIATSPSDTALNIFANSDEIYSFFRVGSAAEVETVVAYLDKCRGGHRGKLDMLFVGDGYLETLGLNPVHVPEGSCRRARSLHFDVQINQAKALRLCTSLMSSSVTPHRSTAAQVREFSEAHLRHNCAAFDASASCSILDCPASGGNVMC